MIVDRTTSMRRLSGVIARTAESARLVRIVFHLNHHHHPELNYIVKCH